jgi:hypothetical protein
MRLRKWCFDRLTGHTLAYMKTLHINEEKLEILRKALEVYLRELGSRHEKGVLSKSLKQYFTREELDVRDLQAEIWRIEKGGY